MYAKRLVCESTGFRYPRRIFNASKGPSNQERRWSCNSLRKDWKIEEIDVRGNEYECLWAKVSTTNRDYFVASVYHPPTFDYHELVSSGYTDRTTSPEQRRDFRCLTIQTELPRRWTLAIFWLPYYTDRFTLPLNIGEISVALLYTDRFTLALNIGEISVASLYRQTYLAAEHRRDFGCFIIQTDLPRHWTSARFRLYISVSLSAYERSIHILRTWRNFCGSVHWKNHIICDCLNADRWIGRSMDQ